MSSRQSMTGVPVARQEPWLAGGDADLRRSRWSVDVVSFALQPLTGTHSEPVTATLLRRVPVGRFINEVRWETDQGTSSRS